MSDKSELKAELERKKQRLAQIREDKKRKEEERKKKEVNASNTRSKQSSIFFIICIFSIPREYTVLVSFTFKCTQSLVITKLCKLKLKLEITLVIWWDLLIESTRFRLETDFVGFMQII